MSSEAFKKLNGGDLSAIKSGAVAPKVPAFSNNFSPSFKTNLVRRPTTDEGGMNKLERERYQYLQALKLGPVPQAITLKFGHDLRFTPDFSYIDANGVMVFEDVKGFQRDDALCKIKACARMFSWARFLIVKKSKDHGWEITEIKP